MERLEMELFIQKFCSVNFLFAFYDAQTGSMCYKIARKAHTMNSEITVKQSIENTLKNFDNQPVRDAAMKLLNTLGYHSKRISNEEFDAERFNRLLNSALETTNPSQKLCIDDWKDFNIIFQISDDEIQNSMYQEDEIEDDLLTSYMFVTVQLKDKNYTRTQLADITRFINKEFDKPIMVIFRYDAVLSLAIINRRRNLVDPSKRVLEKVTLIKDINLGKPKRAHLDIISELYLTRLIQDQNVSSFDTLQKAWEDVLNTEPLNRKFYKEIYEWYQWAVKECKFPDDDYDMQVIRMITRLLFIWFLKEKDLVPEDIFEIDKVEALLTDFSLDTSDYYQAVLQNLFFATLNTPIKERKFSTRDARNHRDASKYRYADLLSDANGFLEHLKEVPFVNGGLFDCLDSFEATSDGGFRIDCFTDNLNDRPKLLVPAKLFYEEDKGIFDIFSHYKFTVEENTPVEQEVALDPELLGQVFENLLGAYNPETQITARKATGSYYTPRQIVNYMVDEVLIAYLLQKVSPEDGDSEFLEVRLRDDLLAYEQQGNIDSSTEHLIYESEVGQIIEAINDLKIIDPAVGTGAFPMGILNKLVLILRKLDPQNEHWKQRQLTQADKIDDPESKESAKQAIEQVFSQANRYNDYGRKLYLIQNCIYGVDIQPIAITIAKLRFFISLIIEQETNNNREANYGIRPLPNLETKFVAANALIGLKELNDPEFQTLLGHEDILELRQEIAEFRRKHFNANTRRIKLDYMRREKACRDQLSETLAAKHAEWREHIQNRIEDQVTQASLPQERAQQLREELQEEYATHEAILTAGLDEAELIANWDAYDQNAVAEFFDAEWMFNVKNGFDIVIGNPPYIERKKISSTDKQVLQAYFTDYFTRTADISVYFYKRAAEFLRNDGILTYICTNKFMRSDYGERLRVFLTSEMTPKTILDFGSISVFEAAVDTCIILVRNSITSSEETFQTAVLRANLENFNFKEAFEKQKFYMNISQLTSEEWTLEYPETLDLLKKIQRTGTPLGKPRLHLGINTGCIDAYIIDSDTREQLIHADINSVNIIKPMLKGRNLCKWKAEWDNLYLILIESSTNKTWPWSDSSNDKQAEHIFAQTYPSIYQYMKRYKEKLSTRTSPGKYYWELRSCAYYEAFTGPKILYADISTSMHAYYDTKGFFGDSTVYCLSTTDLSLLAILNSKIFDWYARYKFSTLNDTWAGGSFRCNKANMKNVPIVDRTPEQKAELSQLVKQILDDPESENVRNLEKQIDDMVYRLYGLSRSEIALIKQTYRDAGMDV